MVKKTPTAAVLNGYCRYCPIYLLFHIKDRPDYSHLPSWLFTISHHGLMEYKRAYCVMPNVRHWAGTIDHFLIFNRAGLDSLYVRAEKTHNRYCFTLSLKLP